MARRPALPVCVFWTLRTQLRQIGWHSQSFANMAPARTDCVLCCRAAASSPGAGSFTGSFLHCNFDLLSVGN